MRIAGLMSGTSIDGLTISLASLREPRKMRDVSSTPTLKDICRRAEFSRGKTYSFPKSLRSQFFTLAEVGNRVSSSDIAEAHRELGEFAANCLKQFANEKPRDPGIDLVAFHGQTIYHRPARPSGTVTLQIGDPSPICIALDVPVVSDFRTMDTAAGGQGAPLVPVADYLRYSSAELARVVLNIGGISNFTFLPRNCKLSDIVSSDIGPGNMLVDGAIGELTGFKMRYDIDGKIATSGKVSGDLLEFIKREDDFRFTRYPKSTGRERYSKSFLARVILHARGLGLPIQDIVATISKYTVFMITHHIGQLEAERKERIDEIIIGGGGSKNGYFLRELKSALPEIRISFHDEYGVPSWCWESFAFSIIAFLSYHRIAGNVPGATGASRPAVLGRINYPSRFTIR